MRPLAEVLADCATDERIASLATPGPYRVNRFDNVDGSISWQVQQDDDAPSVDEECGIVLANIMDSESPRARWDASFYQRARVEWPQRCADLRAMAADVERLTRERDEARVDRRRLAEWVTDEVEANMCENEEPLPDDVFAAVTRAMARAELDRIEALEAT